MPQIPLLTPENSLQVTDRCNMVTLEVELFGDSWTYYVERERLAKKSEWFRAMLSGSFSPSSTNSPPLLRLQYIDKRAFDHFLRYLHDEPVNFISVSTARATLDLAYQYLCLELAQFAAAYLEKFLTPSTVLEIYQGLRFYSNNLGDRPSFNKPLHSPTVPLLSNIEAGAIAAICNDLLLKCLLVIDANSTAVLQQSRFEDLSIEEVAELANRNTLNLKKELILFSALDKWASAECRRQGVEPLPVNKRTVLSDDICFSVRYLLMNDQEFVNGPMASGILTNEECVRIVSKILKYPESLNNDSLQNTMTVHPSKLSDVPRIGTYKDEDCNMLRREKEREERRPDKKKKKKNLERQENRKNRRKECANQGQRTCARIGNCLVQILSCVFD